MDVDARALPSGHSIDADICIIGGGPAGITLAHELSGLAIKVVLVESGDLKARAENDALNHGHHTSDGFPGLELFRRRGFGGASTVWGGRCVSLDPIDFEARDYLPLSGWPIGFAEVSSYYPRAMVYLEAGEAEFDAKQALPNADPFIDGFESDVVRSSSFERFSPPTDFGRRWGPVLRTSANVQVLANATCIGLECGTDGKISRARLATLAGNHLSVRAGQFILAAGGFESFRLLAHSRTPAGHALGNAGGMLGRCLMSHLEATIGTLRASRPGARIAWNFERSRDGVYGRRRLTIAPDVQRRARTLNFSARLHHAVFADPRHRHPVLSAMFLVKGVLLPEYRRKISTLDRAAAADLPRGASFWAAHLRNLFTGLPTLLGFSADWFWRRHLVYRRIPYVVLESRDGGYPVDINAEESPDPANRVVLSDRLDRFGVPLLDVHWRPNPRDLDSIAQNCRLLRDGLAHSGAARFDFDDATLDSDVRGSAPIGGHHIGITRMSRHPGDGVVNADCRVHGLDNLYVASASVFPTSGHANPTLTIVALALRLADHLRAMPRGRA